MTTAYIGIGSNIGDRVSFIQQANTLLKDTEGIMVLDSSSLYETEPIGYKDQEWFVNAVLMIETSLEPHQLLKECLRIELQLGRTRHPENKYGPRTLDLDILFYNNKIIKEECLVIPHPKVHLRAHALVPMLELDPDFVHPVFNKTIAELHSELEEPEEVYLYGTRRIDF